MIDRGVRYVTKDGSDSNDGLSWETAQASPQAAYDGLCTFAEGNYAAINGRHHVGTVKIAGGDGSDYEVGDGLVLRRDRIAEFRGRTTGRAQDRYEGLPRLATTSSLAVEMVSLTDAAAGGSNGYGFGFHNLGFSADMSVSTALTAVIRAGDCNFVDVTGCSVETTGSLPGYFIEADGTLDNSWWTVTNNRVQGAGFIYCVGNVFNNNRWFVSHNSVFGMNTGSGMPGITALIRMVRCVDWTVEHTNLESANVGIHVAGGANNNFINNHGESASFTNPFYWFDSAVECTVIGGRATAHSQGAQQAGRFARISGSARRIVIVNPGLVALNAPASTFKDRVEDVSGTDGNVQVLSGDGFRLSSQALVLPYLGKNPIISQINPDGVLWYNEVDGRILTRLSPTTLPVLVRDREVTRGSSTILDAASSLVVSHGLPVTPVSVTVTPGGNEAVWVTSLGAANFTLNRAGTSGALTVRWVAMR